MLIAAGLEDVMTLLREERVKELRKAYPAGAEVRLKKMNDTQAPPIGTIGTVYHVDDAGTVHIHWDNGSSLGVVPGIDEIELVPKEMG